MNKTELIAAVAKAADLKKAAAEKAITTTIQTIQTALKKGDKVQLIGFGTFESRTRPARTARNPRTGAEIKVKASKAPVFKASKAFKDTLN
ncbi:MAG: HU family DNA-binding protein [Clostridiales bacterium]|nr:HU family DNA-binding protein [Clostridiales bacterium]